MSRTPYIHTYRQPTVAVDDILGEIPFAAPAPLCAVVVDGEVEWNLRDLYEALHLELPDLLRGEDSHDEPTSSTAGEQRVLHRDGVAWPTSMVLEHLDTLPVPGALTGPLGAFVAQWSVRMLDAEVRSSEPATTSSSPAGSARDRLVDPAAAAGSWSVGEAAAILDRDPAIPMSRAALFDLLYRLGWVRKSSLPAFGARVWVPSPAAADRGLLTTAEVFIPRPSRPVYPQVRLTRAGLEQLHGILGGIAPVAVDRAPHPLLVED